MQLKDAINRYRSKSAERRLEELKRTIAAIAILQPREIRLRTYGTHPIEHGRVKDDIARLSRRARTMEIRLAPLLRRHEGPGMQNEEDAFMREIVQGH